MVSCHCVLFCSSLPCRENAGQLKPRNRRRAIEPAHHNQSEYTLHCWRYLTGTQLRIEYLCQFYRRRGSVGLCGLTNPAPFYQCRIVRSSSHIQQIHDNPTQQDSLQSLNCSRDLLFATTVWCTQLCRIRKPPY